MAPTIQVTRTLSFGVKIPTEQNRAVAPSISYQWRGVSELMVGPRCVIMTHKGASCAGDTERREKAPLFDEKELIQQSGEATKQKERDH